MAGRACELGGSCQRALLGLWSERSGLVELQLLCKPSCPDPARAQWGFVRRQGLPGQSSLLIHSLGWRGAALTLSYFYSRILIQACFGGLFSFFQHQETNKQTNKKTQTPQPPRQNTQKTPPRNPKKLNKEKITFFRSPFSTN